jgi:hypothetical protein
MCAKKTLAKRTLVTEKLVGVYLAGVTIRAPQLAHLSHDVQPIGPEAANHGGLYLLVDVLVHAQEAKKRSVCFSQ